MDNYVAMIGLEMHCEISETNTKVFSSAKNDYNELPNSNIRPVDMAFPGILPVVNKEAVRMALMTSLILGCKQPEYMYFERKNYYYPDLPKGFQLSQETPPIPVGLGGKVEFECNGEKKSVRIINLHLEEDAAKLEHDSNTSRIDYNRAGVPLLELVIYPDLRSADEAVAFVEHMISIYRYAGISKADTRRGQIRCDVNVSVMKKGLDETDPKNWGTKVETKNVNSLGGIRDTINYEIERQIDLLEEGKEVKQETRRWDEDTMSTVFMRDKVNAIDYKYFVEPNIPKFKITSEWLEKIKKSIPELASDRKEKYIEKYGLSNYDATILVKDKDVSDYYEETIKLGSDPKQASNWITSVILGHLNKYYLSINDIYLRPNMLADLIKLVEDKTISSKQAKEVLFISLTESKEPTKIVEEKGMKQIGDSDSISKVIEEVLTEQPQAIEQYKAGRTNIVDFLVGQVMKKTKGQANPAMTREMMIKEIEKR